MLKKFKRFLKNKKEKDINLLLYWRKISIEEFEIFYKDSFRSYFLTVDSQGNLLIME